MKKLNVLFLTSISALLGVSCSVSEGGSNPPSPEPTPEPEPEPEPEPYRPDKDKYFIHYNATSPKCTTFGNYECWINKDNGNVLLSDDKPDSDHIEEGDPTTLEDNPFKEYYIAPIGHDLEFSHYKWSLDHESAEAYCACSREGCDHEAFYHADVALNIVTPPSCVAYGEKTYTATFHDENPETVGPYEIAKLDHDFSFKEFKWDLSDLDNITAKAVYECGNGCHVSEEHEAVVTKKEVKQNQSCYNDEVTLYRATYLDEFEEKDVVTKEATHHEGTVTKVDALEETCSTTGNIEYWHCSSCDDYFADEALTQKITHEETHRDIDPTKHDWNDPVYELSIDKSSLKASRICKKNPDHKEEENATVTHVEEDNVITYSYTFNNPAFSHQDETYVISTGCDHEKGTYVEGTDSTCTEKGHIGYYPCTKCDAKFSDEELTHEISDEEYWKELASHNEGTPVVENENEATCFIDGGHDLVTYCTKCGQKLSSEHVNEPAINHKHKEEHPETSSSCYEHGHYDYWYCPDCKQYYSDEACTQVTTLEEMTKPLDDHNLVWEHDDNYHWQKCVNSGCTYVTDPEAHTVGEEELENVYSATCDIDGFHELARYCTNPNCHHECSREHIKDEATGHNWNNVGLRWSNLDTLPALSQTFECTNAGCEDVVSNPVFVANENPIHSPSGNDFSNLAKNPTTKSAYGDVNICFKHESKGLPEFHAKLYVRIEHDGALNNAQDALLIKVDNGKGYTTTHMDGEAYFLIRSDYSASNDSLSSGFRDIVYGDNKSSFNSDEFCYYMQKALVTVDVDYDVISANESTVTIVVTYYTMMEGEKAAQYMGYTQTYQATLGSDTSWEGWPRGTLKTVRIARPVTSDNSGLTYHVDKIYTTDVLDHGITKMDGSEIRSYTHSLTEVPEVAPTCTEAGMKKHYTCSNHQDEYWLDLDHYEQATRGELVIPPTGHDLEMVWYNEELAYHCKTCNRYFQDPECQHEVI